MEELRVDREQVAALYRLSQLLKKSMNDLLNQILKESIPYYKLRANNLALVQVSFEDLENVFTLRRTEKRFAHLHVCPSCISNFDVRRGRVLRVEISPDRFIKLLICANCYSPPMSNSS